MRDTFLQRLERRRLLSTSLENGVVNVVGGGGNDDIEVSVAGAKLRVRQAATVTDFALAAVSRIEARGLGGDDVLAIADQVTIPTLLDGGPGRDLITGGSGADTINGGLGDDVLDGGAGRDVIDGGLGFFVLQGGDGDDLLNGGEGDDELFGEDGADTLRGGLGADMMSGGDGFRDVVDYADRTADLYIVQNGEADDGEVGEGDRIRLNNEIIVGGVGNDFIRSGELNETVYGGAGDDTIDGDEGNDAIYGQAGDDSLFGGEQDDAVYGGDGDDTINGGDNVPGEAFESEFGPVYGRGGFDRLYGEDGNDDINGGDSDDYIDGGNDDDFLYGSQGNDSITGGDGDDTLIGGSENDQLVGGAGADLFSGNTGVDTADFSDHDAANAGPDTFVFVTLDDAANDGLYVNGGQLGVEHDNVMSDVERVIGTNGRDGMSGSAAPNWLDGRGGDDTLIGGGGDDTLRGGDGDDQLFGRDGTDAAADEHFYAQTNLVSNDQAKYGSLLEDPHLTDAWGLALRPPGAGGHIWVSNASDGSTTTYIGDVPGMPLFQDALTIVNIPAPAGSEPGEISTPTGQVYNAASDLPGQSTEFLTTGLDQNGNVTTGSAKFVFVTTQGQISSWRLNTAVRMPASVDQIDKSGDDSPAQYFGIAITTHAWKYDPADPDTYAKGNHIYVADFANQRIETYDNQWNEVTGDFPFAQPAGVPADYSPWNIQYVDGKLYVEYAQVLELGVERHGPGLGYIARFNIDGTLDTLFADHRALNAPWGITKAPADFGPFSNTLLVANFGDGTVAALDEATGAFIDFLRAPDGRPISIEGVWGLAFGNGVSLGTANHLYFTAGPRGERDGIFGKLALGDGVVSDDDVLGGGAGADQLHGETGRDRLTGGPGADGLFGGDDDDFFINAGDGGADQLDGGGGDDAMEADDLDAASDVHTTIPPPAPQPFPALAPVAPLGSYAYHGVTSGTVAAAPGGRLVFTIRLEAGQRVTVVTDPDAGFQPAIALDGPGMTATADATGAGRDAVLQALAVAQGGIYTLTVSSADAGGGGVAVDVWVNAAVEAEAHGQGFNNSFIFPQDLDGAFVGLGGTADRAVVIGQIAGLSASDFYSVTLAALRPVDIVMSGGAFGFELLDARGAMIASGTPDSSGLISIPSFVPSETGTYFVRVLGTAAAADYALVVVRGAAFDAAPPTVVASRFRHDAAPGRIEVTFSEDVAVALDSGGVFVTRVGPGGGATFVPSSVSFDSATHTAAFMFATPLPDGDYQLTLSPVAVKDLAGNPLAAQGAALDFFVLRGDVNRDRAVDFNDLVVLAQNYNVVGGRTWEQGDFTGDGSVDFDDLVVLAQRYNTALPGAGIAAGQPSFAAAFAAVAPARVAPAPSRVVAATGGRRSPVIEIRKPVKVVPPPPPPSLKSKLRTRR